jgi:hypothetical protein
MCLLNWKFSGSFSQSDLQKEEEGAGLVPSCSDALIDQNFRKPCYITCIFLPSNYVRIHTEQIVTLKMEVTGYS